MNSTQLTHIFRKDEYSQGVLTWIISEKPGSHWVAFYFTKDQKGKVFDSNGLSPTNYTGTFSSFLKNNSNGWSFNSVTLQSINSKVCGHYCLYYALFRCRNIGMSTIVHRFSKNKQRNDFLVKRFIEKHCPLSLKTYHAHENIQGAKAQHQVQ